MTEVARFFDAVSYGEGDQAEVQARMVRDGVCAGVANQLAVTSGGTGFATVDTGEAFVQGFWYKNSSTKVLAVSANASASPRIDYVVLKLDRTGNSLVAVVKEGTIGGGAPILIQIAGGTWEFPLAQITTVSGVSTYVDMRVTPKLLYSPVESVDILNGTIQGPDISPSAALAIGTMNTTGDVVVTRSAGGSPTTGVVYFGNNSGTRYIYYDGTNFNVSGPIVMGNLTATGTISLPANSITQAMLGASIVTQVNMSGEFGSSTAAGPWYVINGSIGYAVLYSCTGGPILIIFSGVASGTNTDYAIYMGISVNSSASPQYQQAMSSYTTQSKAFCLSTVTNGPVGGNAVYYGVGGSQLGNVVFTSCRIMAMEFKK